MSENRTVLVVEDEAIIALDLEATLSDAGWAVLGPVGTAEHAFALISDALPDVACLDLNLGKGTSHELARALVTKDIPVVFLSGRDSRALPDDLKGIPLLGKPIDDALLCRTLAGLLPA